MGGGEGLLFRRLGTPCVVFSIAKTTRTTVAPFGRWGEAVQERTDSHVKSIRSIGSGSGAGHSHPRGAQRGEKLGGLGNDPMLTCL